MVLQPPNSYDLRDGAGAAVAPVTLNNVGQPASEPVDAYWGPIYERCGLDPKDAFTVETFVDSKSIRAWLNCGMFSVRADLGLFRQWATILEEFVRNEEYQRSAITDGVHKTFLHQAVISSLIVAQLDKSEIRMLPEGYNYPLFCHDLEFTTQTGDTYKIPASKRVDRFSDLTSMFSETLFLAHPDWVKYVPSIEEPMRSWMLDEYYSTLTVVDHIYREENSCNSYLVTTENGSVLIDPGGAAAPESALRQLDQKWPVQAVLLTHAHHDHIKGIETWTQGRNIPVIGQRELVDFMAHNDRLHWFDQRRLAIQSGTPLPPIDTVSFSTPVPATVLFDDNYTYEYGGLHFEMFHTGGETPDQCVIWVPELKAVFIGDNYYSSFPNTSTLRGSPFRPPLEYIAALDKAISLGPEIVMPGHGEPLLGQENIHNKLTRYRDAIQYVHDATVKGMNEGKDVFTLMQEINLPPALRLPQFFGRVSWVVRGIFDGYAGWFDENLSSMYKLPLSSIDSELVLMCGGVEALASHAAELSQSGDEIRALHMTDIGLTVDPNHRATLEARLTALKSLLAKSGNIIERNWLNYGIRTAEEKLKNRP
jgi:glyoxylase-like metal-dependent hydrolase (beta-lactamase superfamily II)